jgi:hypothetical protein
VASRCVANVLARLKKVKKAGKGWVARCPAHDDSKPSLSISEGTDGRVLLNCHAGGCSAEAIVGALRLEMSDLFPDDGSTRKPLPPPPPPRQKPVQNKAAAEDPERHWPIVAQYDYTDSSGGMQFQVIRKEPALQLENGKRQKTFFQRRPDGAGGWKFGLGDMAVRPLYRLPELIEDLAIERVVLLVEGEKDVETARGLGLAATTHMGGSKAWRPEYAEALRDGHVVIIPDNDGPGREWALEAATSLHGVAASLRILPLPGVSVGGDLTDWIHAGGTRGQLDRLLLRARPWLPGNPIPEPTSSRFRVFSDLELESMPPMQWLANGIFPATSLLALCGAPGCGKSFVAMDLALSIAIGRQWFGQDVLMGSVLYVAAEGSAGMRQRLIAWKQHASVTSVTGVGFVVETANLLQATDVEHVMRAIDTLPDEPRLIVFDTLARSMPGGDENDTEDMSVVVDHIDRLRKLTSASVLVVHHTRKDSDTERGSSALRGGVDTLAFVREDEAGRVLVCDKQKDSPPFEPLGFSLAPVNPSCVVMHRGTLVEDALNALTPRMRAVLGTLRTDFTSRGATTTEWLKSCEGKIPERSFYRARTWLVQEGYVIESKGGVGSRYTLSDSGRTATAATFVPPFLPTAGELAARGELVPTPLKGLGTTPAPSPQVSLLFQEHVSDGSGTSSGSGGRQGGAA